MKLWFWCFLLLLLWGRAWAGTYEPKDGDLVFQPLPRGALVDAIESVSLAPVSHCGIVVQCGGQWMVLESHGTVGDPMLGSRILWMGTQGGDSFYSPYPGLRCFTPLVCGGGDCVWSPY